MTPEELQDVMLDIDELINQVSGLEKTPMCFVSMPGPQAMYFSKVQDPANYEVMNPGFVGLENPPSWEVSPMLGVVEPDGSIRILRKR